MNTDHYIALIYKQLKGDITPDEAKDLHSWESASSKNRAEADAIRNAWSASAQHDLPFELDMDADFAAVQSRIATDQSSAKTVQMKPRRNNWMRIAAAVAFLIIAGFALNNFLNGSAEWNTVTAGADTEQIQLADGTSVWLNAGSSLSYPADFSGTQRSVRLIGEAYFEVTKNAKKRFQVMTDETTITVLGTAFNVRESDAGDMTTVSVSEGKVQVEATASKAKVILSVNEKATLDHTTNTLTEENDSDLNDTAWKRGSLRFNGTKMTKVLSEIGDFYGIKITLTDEKMSSCEVSARYTTDPSAEVILQQLIDFYGFEKQESSTTKDVILSGGTCR